MRVFKIYYRHLALLYYVAGLIALWGLTCNDTPLEPLAPGWVRVDVFPPSTYEVNSIYNARTIWAVVRYREGNRSAILDYAGGQFVLEFETPEEYDAILADIGFDRNVLTAWAVGSKYLNGTWSPYMVRYTQETRLWKEVMLPVFPERTLSKVLPINESECWLLFDRQYYSGDHDGVLAKYSDGAFRFFDEFGPVTAVYTDSEYLRHTLIAATYVPNGQVVKGDIKIYITPDGGASWVGETLVRGLVKGREIVAAEVHGHFGPEVYFSVRFADGALGIVKRKGLPGGGVYEPVFIAYAGPYCQDINSIAFRDPHSAPYGISADGVAVGLETTIVFEEGLVYLEKIPYPMELSSIINAGGNGFFAVGKDLTFRDYDLLYHP